MSPASHRRAASALLAACVATLGAGATTGHADAVDATKPAQSDRTQLESVSASSATDAWAVGFRTAPGANTAALTRHWDGEHWQVVDSVHPSEYSFLWGVADISPTDVWAVGEMIGSAEVLPFAEHWDGSQWTQIDIIHRPGMGKLTAVSASGPDDVWMVGSRDDQNPFQRSTPFIAHWDGHRISVVHPARYQHARTTELTGVSAAATDDVWAVGTHGRHGETDAPLLEHYDGVSWSLVPSDPAQGKVADLSGVAAVAPDDAWSVGWYVAPGHTTISAYAQHWDGSAWTQSQSRHPATARTSPGSTSSLRMTSGRWDPGRRRSSRRP